MLQDKVELMRCLQENLQQPDYQEALASIASPLNNSHRLGKVWYDLTLALFSVKHCISRQQQPQTRQSLVRCPYTLVLFSVKFSVSSFYSQT